MDPRADDPKPTPKSDRPRPGAPRVAALAGAALLCAAAPARGDGWVEGELPAAVPISAPQRDDFAAGWLPALGVYLGLGEHAAVGLRMRAGALGNAAAHAPGAANPGRGGLIAGELALRLAAGDTWIEAAAGGGATGHDAVPTFEVGVGRTFDAGRLAIGPSLRYLRVVGGAHTMVDPGSAEIVLVGIQVGFGRRARHRAPPEVVARPAPPAPVRDVDRIADRDQPCPAVGDGVAAGCAPPDRDGDGIPDAVDRCPDQAEVVNGVDDDDGCPDQGLFAVEDDRIVLDDRILFDTNRARIKHRGRPVIAAIAHAWQVHGEWARIVVQGYADVRGPTPFNDWLSDTRAERARAALVAAGIPADCIAAEGFGAAHPRDPHRTLAAYARNRRVEFLIVRGRRTP